MAIMQGLGQAIARIAGTVVDRFADRALVVVLSLTIGALLFRPIQSLGWWYLETIDPWGCLTDFAVRTAMASSAFYCITAMGVMRAQHLSNARGWVRSPPTWMVGLATGLVFVLGIPLFHLAYRSVFSLGGTLAIFDAIAPSVIAFFGSQWAYSFWAAKKSTVPVGLATLSQVPQADTAGGGESQLRRFLAWIHREEPITSATDDLFDMDVQAGRLVDRLLSPEFPGIGIVGEYGSGKSSLLGLVQASVRMKRIDTIHFCHINMWGKAGRSAVHSALSEAITILAPCLDVSSLIDLPLRYLLNSKGITGVFAGILSVLPGSLHTSDKLDRLDAILSAQEHRLVFLIEDLDRNNDDSEAVAAIAALLDRLNRLRHVIFVLTVGRTTLVPELLLRLCQHTVRLYAPSVRYRLQQLQDFRKLVPSHYSDDIDALQPGVRNERFLGTENSDAYLAENGYWAVKNLWRETYPDPVEDVAELLDTPRSLKAALREAWFSLSGLHGEIDPDDALVVAAFRVRVPDFHTGLMVHAHRIVDCTRRLIEDSRGSSESTKEALGKRDVLRGQLVGLLATLELPEGQQLAADRLMEFLFPGWAPDRIWTRSRTWSPQGVRYGRPVDYWRRLHEGRLRQDETPDQEVLRAISEWTLTKDDEQQDSLLPTRLLESVDFGERLQHLLTQQLDMADYHRLVEVVLDRYLSVHGNAANPRKCLALPVLSHVQDSVHLDPDVHWKAAVSWLRKAMAVSLRFANDVYEYFVMEAGKRHTCPEPGQTHAVYGKLAREQFAEHPAALVRVVDPGFAYSCYHFCVNLATEERHGAGFDPQGWHWFADLLLDAASVAPLTMVPQIAPFLADSEDLVPPGRRKYRLAVRTGEQLFTSRYTEVMRLFAGFELTAQLDSETEEMMRFLVPAAKTWVSQNVPEQTQQNETDRESHHNEHGEER